MKLKHFVIMVIAAGCIFMYPVQAAQISVEPSHIIALQEDYFMANITVYPANENIRGAAFELYFDNSLLNATSLAQGTFFNGFDTLSYGEGVNPALGKIDYAEVMTGHEDEGAANPGILATITFQTIAEQGVSGLRLENVKLSDPYSTPISTEVNNATVEIAQPSTPFLIHGNVSYKDGSYCNDPAVNITNLNTSREWSAETNETLNYYQLTLASCDDVVTGEILRFDATSPDGRQLNITEHIVTHDEVDAGGFEHNIALEYCPGDVNGDGRITPADAGIALQMAVCGEYDPLADVDYDDSVTSLDALMILQAADEI